MEKTTILEKTKTALVVIDLQKGILSAGTVPHDASDVVKRAATLADEFRKNNMPVFLVHVSFSPDRKDALSPRTDAAPMNMSPAADWAEFMPEMGPKEKDFIITKHQWGAFSGTELDVQLRRRGIDTIVLCGVSTNMGVESTARFAYELGYNQIFVEDATAARKVEEHTFPFNTSFLRMGLVRSTEEVMKSLK